MEAPGLDVNKYEMNHTELVPCGYVKCIKLLENRFW